jgi:drug/metabolite transporter (DMT)-like permease
MSDHPTAASPVLTPATIGLLLLPPLVWAGNSVLGKLVADIVPPITLNFFRWLLATLLLMPWAWRILLPSSPLWPLWRRYAVMSLLGVGCYNSFQYLALHTSTPINVTLVGSSVPVFMLALGVMFFKQRIRPQQLLGAAMSIAGVLCVLGRGDWQTLMRVEWVIGDVYVLIAVLCWATYSWLVSLPQDPPEIRGNWAYFLMGQMVFGLVWCGLFTALEWRYTDNPHIDWGWPLAAALVYVALGPALLAYRSWGLGIQRVGPNVAGFFANLTPLFAAVMSTAFLGEAPHFYHLAAFLLIAGGIVVSSHAVDPR